MGLKDYTNQVSSCNTEGCQLELSCMESLTKLEEKIYVGQLCSLIKRKRNSGNFDMYLVRKVIPNGLRVLQGNEWIPSLHQIPVRVK